MSKRNFLTNALLKKCPRCQEGDLFIKPFEFTKPLNMPERCPVCHQKFEPEPGFYYGAMFLSYIFSAFFFLGIVGENIRASNKCVEIKNSRVNWVAFIYLES